MTVPAPSLPSVLPGAPIPKTGSGGAATGFEALLAGLGPRDVKAGPTRGAFAAPEADADLQAEDAATAQDPGLTLLLGAPAQAPVPVVPTAANDAADGVTFAARQIRVPGFAAWRSAEAGVALPNALAAEPSTPVVSRAPETDPAAPVAAPLNTVFADARAPRPFATPAAAEASAETPSILARPSSDVAKAATASAMQPAPAPAAPAQTAAVTQVQAQTLASPVADKTAAAAATAPLTAAAAASASAPVAAPVAVAATPVAASAPAAPVEGEPRRSASAARNERRTETAGPAPFAPSDAGSEASPVKQAALAAAETLTGGVDADASGDPPAADTPEAAETRQPAQLAEARVPAAQTAAVKSEATAARATPETVARFAADVVRKLDGQSTRFGIQLDPYGLGKVDVAIEIDRNGKLTAAMSFDSPQSAADLGSRAADLRLALEQAGFDVADDGLTFDLAGQGAGSGGREAGQQQDRAWNGRAFQRAQAGADETDLSRTAAPSPTDRRTRSGVDIRI
ncbi:MAG: flagellar hook-length control protein FliK [Caulobacter sp.]|nr:flagellar hook-length control protein FliK [Caulobacter sp.]